MKFRSLDLNLLLVLEALFREQTVTGVATTLGVSQPMVSQSLAKLRGLYGDALFVRKRSRMQPTPFAATLRAPLTELVATLERDILPDPGFDPAASRRTFTICTSDSGELCFVPRLAAAMARRAPSAVLRNVTLSPAQLRDEMAGGTVDLALGSFPEIDPDATDVERLFSDEFVCLVRSRHPIVGGGMTLERFMACEHAVVSTRNRSRGLLAEGLRAAGLELKVRVRPEHFLGIGALIAGSDLIATVPRSVAELFASASLELHAPPFPLPVIELRQHWHRRRAASSELKWFSGLVSELFGSNAGGI